MCTRWNEDEEGGRKQCSSSRVFGFSLARGAISNSIFGLSVLGFEPCCEVGLKWVGLVGGARRGGRGLQGGKGTRRVAPDSAVQRAPSRTVGGIPAGYLGPSCGREGEAFRISTLWPPLSPPGDLSFTRLDVCSSSRYSTRFFLLLFSPTQTPKIKTHSSPPLRRPFRYETMTDVQAAVLSHLPRLSSSPSATPFSSTNGQDALDQAQDLLVRAKTGTGKTLAFLIPALEGRLRALSSFLTEYQAANPDSTAAQTKKALERFATGSVGALIISPTRELATQIAQEASALTSHLSNFGVRLLVGGEPRGKQLRDWTRPGASNDIVVATPGRMVDLIQSESAVRNPLANTRMLILDEADTLLDMGFASEIATISEYLPEIADRQTFLFSATVSKSIREVARKMMKVDHTFIDTVGRDSPDTHLHIPQYYTVLPSAEEQISHIVTLLAQDQLLHPDGGKAVIFLPTTKLTMLFSTLLSTLATHLPWGRRTSIMEIHSKKDQGQRTRASAAFRTSTSPYSILVTSDVSARGVDYPGVTRVIQVGIPGSRDLYIHRVGRTGRAGKSGRGDLVVLPFERDFVKNTLGDLKLRRYEVGDAMKETAALAAEWDAAPPTPRAPVERQADVRRRDKRFGSSSSAPSVGPAAPAGPRLEKLETSLRTNVLPALDIMDIKETFASLLGYYIPKSSDMRTRPDEVVKGLQEWAMGGWGLDDAPFVSDTLLRKMGAGSGGGRGGGSRGGSRGGFGGGSRGGFGGRGDRDGGRGDRDGGRSERKVYGGDRDFSAPRGDRRDFSAPRGDRDFSAPRRDFAGKSDRGGYAGKRDDGERERSSAGFGYGGKSTLFGAGDADAWERPVTASRGRKEGGGRRDY